MSDPTPSARGAYVEDVLRTALQRPQQAVRCPVCQGELRAQTYPGGVMLDSTCGHHTRDDVSMAVQAVVNERVQAAQQIAASLRYAPEETAAAALRTSYSVSLADDGYDGELSWSESSPYVIIADTDADVVALGLPQLEPLAAGVRALLTKIEALCPTLLHSETATDEDDNDLEAWK